MTRIDADWIAAPASCAVMTALGDGYFVGGCVRNALLEVPVADVDVATPLLPEQVVKRLEVAGLKAVPTGLKHGTVTAVYDRTPIEVTTFRADVQTDGRHAEVAFTTDMGVDAQRRDFTINALYADATGRVIDPLNGLPDLRARRVRFIGRPEDRITEDYLRILRFFRFFAWYGAVGIDADGLAACAAMVDGLDHLARERVGWEFRKLLASPDPAPAVAAMASSGVLGRCLPGATPVALAPLVHLEREEAIAADWRTRLAAIGGEDVAGRLRLSRAETAYLMGIAAAVEMVDLAEAAYRFGAAAAQASALIRAASVGTTLPTGWQRAIARGAEAVFPLNAQDLIALGWVPGPELGAVLKAAEHAWVASDFTLDKHALMRSVAD